MRTLEFWFDIASTYSYLSALRVEEAARRTSPAIDVAWRPFSLGPVFARRGLTTSPFNVEPAKGAYMWRDVAREAAALGLPFRKPSVFPRNSIAALRVAALGAERPWGPRFVRAAFTANFAEDRAIESDAVLDEILGDVGLDAAEIRAEAASPEWKPRLRAATERAVELGIFGAPTFFVGGEMHWGNDRLDRALEAARAHGGSPTDDAVAAELAKRG